MYADEALTSPEEISDEVAGKLLQEYERECQGRLSRDNKSELKCKEKGDMVLVSRSGESGSTSPGKGGNSHWLPIFSDSGYPLATFFYFICNTMYLSMYTIKFRLFPIVKVGRGRARVMSEDYMLSSCW